MKKIIRNFGDIFNKYPRNVRGLILDGLKKYSRFKKNKARMGLFMEAAGFTVDGDVKKDTGYGEIYSGNIEIFSCTCIAEEFFPVSVMMIDIILNTVKVSISSDWRNFHEDVE